MTVSKKTPLCPLYIVAFAILVFFSSEEIVWAEEEMSIPIVAVGDLHADLVSARKAFQIAGITNSSGEWVLKNTIVVQTGDLTDRGPDGKPLLDWIKGLEEQATEHNSQFVVLLGNHEVMNLQGDWRYVSSLDIESFGGLEARKSAFSISDNGMYAQWLKIKMPLFKLERLCLSMEACLNVLQILLKRCLKRFAKRCLVKARGVFWANMVHFGTVAIGSKQKTRHVKKPKKC